MDYLEISAWICVKLEAGFLGVFPRGCWEDWRLLELKDVTWKTAPSLKENRNLVDTDSIFDAKM